MPIGAYQPTSVTRRAPSHREADVTLVALSAGQRLLVFSPTPATPGREVSTSDIVCSRPALEFSCICIDNMDLPSLPLQILQSYHPVVRTLGEYLDHVTEFNHDQTTNLGVVHETDTAAYRRLIATCLVTTRSTDIARKFLKVTPVIGHLREVGRMWSPRPFN